MNALIGTRIANKYSLQEFLGEGGLGRVFLAEQQPIGRKVALKLLHPELSQDASIVARFEREAQAASRISHPNAVVIYDFGHDTIGAHKQLYLVMEFLSGQTLHDRIQNHPKRRLPSWEAVHILCQVLKPLAAFHKAGVVHRDLKPDNIMLCQSDLGEQVKLLDFGIAKVSGVSLTATGQMVGTPHYMSPEQIMSQKDLGPTVDIYSMGILLYEALTGDPPYLAEHHIDLFRMHLKETPKPLTAVLPHEKFLAPFDAVIQKAMAKKPQDRYQSADELRQAMEDALLQSVGMEEEAQEKTTVNHRIAMPWGETSEEEPAVLLMLEEEESTHSYQISQANTVSMPALQGVQNEDTVKMPQLVLGKTILTPPPLEESWKLPAQKDLQDAALKSTALLAKVRPHPTWITRIEGFWRRVAKFWQIFRFSKQPKS